MTDYQYSPQVFWNGAMGSLQPRDQVADKRAEPVEEICRLFSGPLQDGLHDWYTCRDAQSCISPVWSAATTQNGLNEPDPDSRNFPSSNEWYRRGGQNSNDGKDVVLLPVCAVRYRLEFALIQNRMSADHLCSPHLSFFISVNSTPSAHTFLSCSFCQRACPGLLSELFRLTAT